MSAWTSITNCGTVLIMINRQDMLTTCKIAQELNITERSVIRIINNLESGGYLCEQRSGRSTHYKVNLNEMLR